MTSGSTEVFYAFETLSREFKLNPRKGRLLHAYDKGDGRTGASADEREDLNGHRLVSFTIEGKREDVRAYRVVYALFKEINLTRGLHIEFRDRNIKNTKPSNLVLVNSYQDRSGPIHLDDVIGVRREKRNEKGRRYYVYFYHEGKPFSDRRYRLDYKSALAAARKFDRIIVKLDGKDAVTNASLRILAPRERQAVPVPHLRPA